MRLAVLALLLAPSGVEGLFADSKYLVTDLKADRKSSCVIVAADEFADACDRLLAHREKRGHTVAVVRASDVFRAFGAGKPSPDALAAFSKHAHARWSTRFLLLAGDVERLPAHVRRSEYQTTRYPNDEELGTDHFIAEPGVAVGRFPADTPAELAAMIAKTVDYETRSVPGPWQRRISFITGEGGFGTFIDGFIEAQFTKIVADTIPAPFDIEVAYAKPSSPYSPHPTRFNDCAIRLLNEAPLFYVYVGHGKRSGCDTIEFKGEAYPILETAHVPRVRVRGHGPVMVVIACNTGEYDGKTSDCLGEELMKSPTGPVAFIGGSRITQPYGNAVLGRELIGAFLQEKPTIGEALFAAKGRAVGADDSDFRKTADRLAGTMQGGDSLEPMRKDVALHYNLLGDPALSLRRPDALEVAAKQDGRRVRVSGRAPIGDGRALVSLDCPREKFLRPPGKVTEIAQFAERYRLANDKSVARAEVAVTGGAFEVEFEVPAGTPKGRHWVRAFAWSDSGAAAGAKELVLGE